MGGLCNEILQALLYLNGEQGYRGAREGIFWSCLVVWISNFSVSVNLDRKAMPSLRSRLTGHNSQLVRNRIPTVPCSLGLENRVMSNRISRCGNVCSKTLARRCRSKASFETATNHWKHVRAESWHIPCLRPVESLPLVVCRGLHLKFFAKAVFHVEMRDMKKNICLSFLLRLGPPKKA